MIVKIVLAAVGVAFGLYGLHRLFTYLEDAGYMYYRKPREGGVAKGLTGTFNEMDRLIRPSVQHTREAEQIVRVERDDVGGD